MRADGAPVRDGPAWTSRWPGVVSSRPAVPGRAFGWPY